MHNVGIDKDKVTVEGMRGYLDELHKYFLSHLNKYTSGENNGYSLQFTHDNVDVDLLLSPYWEDKEELYAHLKTLNKSEQRK